ncbi:response regulator [uncultured Algimonas sp.]|uniref:response regulator n=1 Tax=uncultured Algimonas sp. TaxID=1547920 RepID=UPI00261AFE05|nr:response regulator [uncultured Algimonas sp.]
MTIKVLAIDDSRTIRSLMNATLTDAGFDSCIAEDGVDGLAKMEDFAPDVIITDLNMPNLDGFGVIDGVRNHPVHGSCPVLVLTTESSTELKTRARDAGATGWIVKPFDRDRLVGAINRVAG